MVGITGYGAYLPRYRMDRSVVLQQVGWFNRGLSKGEKAVANCDEDSVTMAYAAARECLKGPGADEVDALYMASLSFPFKLRQNAAIVSEALNLNEAIRTADYTSSPQCGTDAMLSALDAAACGSARQAIVCASDARRAKPGSSQEYTWGDGAAAIRFGSENILAAFLGASSVTSDFIDKRIIDTEEFERVWEDRWLRDEGYLKLIPKVVTDLLKKTGTSIEDYAKVCIACPNSSALKAIGKKCGLSPEQIADNLVGTVGDLNSSMPAMMLVSALEAASAGDKIMLVSFGYGARALAFEATQAVTSAASRGCLAAALARKTPLKEYARYLAYKGLVDFEMGIRGETVAPTAMSVLHQQGKAITCLEGVRCTACGTPQYPKHTVCANPGCNAVGQMEPYIFSDKIGAVASFTADSLAFSWDPPQLDGMLDFDEGGRLFMDFTDCTKDDVSVGIKMQMTFRRKYADKVRGHYGYYWKAMPVK